MTVLDDAAVVSDVVVASFTMPGAVARDALVGAVVAAGRDKGLPALCGVLIEWADGDRVRMVATDRYRLCVADTKFRGVGDARVLVARADVDALVKALPKVPARGKDTSMVTFTVADRVLVVRFVEGDWVGAPSWSREVRLVDADFPQYRSLVPTEFGGVDGIAWNAAYMADVDKIPHGKNMPVSWRFTGAGKPMVGTFPTHNCIDFLYMLMPVRLTGSVV